MARKRKFTKPTSEQKHNAFIRNRRRRRRDAFPKNYRGKGT